MGTTKEQLSVQPDPVDEDSAGAVSDVADEDDEAEAEPPDELSAEAAADFYAAAEASADEIVQSPALEYTADSLQLFLKDVGRVSLLTAAQEVELAKRIE